MNRIDVIVPCHNYGSFLRPCIDSVLQQEGVEVRVLIIDDASTDDSHRVGARIASQTRAVEIRHHELNRGHIATYNEGLEWAAREYTLLLSADDLLSPGALRRATQIMEKHPQIGLTCGRQIVFAGEPPEEEAPRPGAATPWRELTPAGFQQLLCESGANPVATPSAVVRTRLVKELGGYRADLPHTADMEYWLRIATRASVALLDTVQAYKRQHEHNMQIDYTSDMERDLLERWRTFQLHFGQNRPLPPNADQLLRTAGQALAREMFWSASAAFDRGEVAATNRLLELALECDAGIVEEGAWRRLRWKQRVGPTAWKLLRSVIRTDP